MGWAGVAGRGACGRVLPAENPRDMNSVQELHKWDGTAENLYLNGRYNSGTPLSSNHSNDCTVITVILVGARASHAQPIDIGKLTLYIIAKQDTTSQSD